MTSPPTSSQTILVSGATGFVATHVIKTLLNRGYKVRGTVRSEKSGITLANTFADHPSSANLSSVIVPDIAANNAFHEAVKGVDGIMHLASPFQFVVEDNERDLLKPAISGMKNMLQAAMDNAPKVKRIVCTSSFAANITVEAGYRPGYTYTEKDWNPCSYEKALFAGSGAGYCASKACAERVAWEFVKAKSPQFDLAMINPVLVFGPVEHSIANMKRLNQSARDVYQFLDGTHETVNPALTPFPVFCDARDVAEAHLRAYERPEAGGERLIICSGNFFFEEVCRIMAKIPGQEDRVSKVPKDWTKPTTESVYTVDTSHTEKVLGMKFKSLEESITDTAKSLFKLENDLGVNKKKELVVDESSSVRPAKRQKSQ